MSMVKNHFLSLSWYTILSTAPVLVLLQQLYVVFGLVLVLLRLKKKVKVTSVGQSVLVSGTHLEPTPNLSLSLFDHF
jgi:hypothetical protein